jgi:hypothetical protein
MGVYSPASSNDGLNLLAHLTHAVGSLAKVVHHLVGMGIKHEKPEPNSLSDLENAVQNAVKQTVALAEHFNIRHALTNSVEEFYTKYQEKGYIAVADSNAITST